GAVRATGCGFADPPTLHLSTENGARRHDVTVYEQHRPFASVLFVDPAVMRDWFREVDSTVVEKAVVGENQQLVRNRRRKWIIRGVHDNSAEESLPYRVASPMVRMRMVPVSARRSGTNGEYVVVFLAGLGRLEWT